jgi:hypothetical protein
MTISDPVQMAVCPSRRAGALCVAAGRHESEGGWYRPPLVPPVLYFFERWRSLYAWIGHMECHRADRRTVRPIKSHRHLDRNRNDRLGRIRRRKHGRALHLL